MFDVARAVHDISARVVYVSLCDAEQRAFAWAPVDLVNGGDVAWPYAPAAIAHWLGFLDVHGVTLWWQSIQPLMWHEGIGARVSAPTVTP